MLTIAGGESWNFNFFEKKINFFKQNFKEKFDFLKVSPTFGGEAKKLIFIIQN